MLLLLARVSICSFGGSDRNPFVLDLSQWRLFGTYGALALRGDDEEFFTLRVCKVAPAILSDQQSCLEFLSWTTVVALRGCKELIALVA